MRNRKKNDAGELELIRTIRDRASKIGSSRALALGIGDDCALLRLKPGEEVAVTTDLSIDGRHFRLGWHPAEAVGHRTLARGLSDLAAMGARPLAAFISLGLPENLTKGRSSWISRFYDALLALAETHECPVAGGDLAQSPVALADIVLTGAVPRGRALLRSGARPGDLVYVTGKLGGAAAGLARLTELAAGSVSGKFAIPKKLGPTLQSHLYPQPRIPQGLWLQRRGAATSCIDISDGLSTDLLHLCEESAVRSELDADTLPIAPGATLEQALHGGEGYELLFTARPDTRLPGAIAGVPVTQIGRMVRRRAGQPEISLRTTAGIQPLERRGWEHFSSR